MKLEVLISCMRQDDLSIIRRSNVLTDVLVINQGDGEDTIEDILKLVHFVLFHHRICTMCHENGIC